MGSPEQQEGVLDKTAEDLKIEKETIAAEKAQGIEHPELSKK